MYQSHWGLRESPFRNCLNPEAFYQSPTHEEALARMLFLVEEQRRLGMLTGPSGSGKSLLLEVFAAQLRRSGRAVAKIELIGLDPVEMLWSLVTQLGGNLEPTDSEARLWRTLTDRLTEFRYQQCGVVMLLDDADQAHREVLPHLMRLAKSDPSPGSRLTMILAGQRQRLAQAGTPLVGLAELRIDVEPWAPDDTERFLSGSLVHAGRKSPVFAGPAIERLHELSHGIPRQVCQLADLALIVGAGRELNQIDAEVIESVYEELAAC